MNKSIIAITFLTLFLSFSVVPSLVVLVDDSFDISLVYDITEEEENKGKEQDAIKNTLFSHYGELVASTTYSVNSFPQAYLFKTYTTPHLNLISPPPDFYLL